MHLVHLWVLNETDVDSYEKKRVNSRITLGRSFYYSYSFSQIQSTNRSRRRGLLGREENGVIPFVQFKRDPLCRYIKRMHQENFFKMSHEKLSSKCERTFHSSTESITKTIGQRLIIIQTVNLIFLKTKAKKTE